MKKNVARICMLLVVCICMSTLSLTSIAEKKSIKGKVSVSVVISKGDINAFKSSMADAKKDGENYYKDLIANTTDKDKIDQLKKMLEYSQSINIDNLFNSNEDGSATLEIPYGNAELAIDGKEVRTDAKGNYELDNIENKEYEVSVSRENKKIAKQKVKFDKRKSNNDIKITRSLETLGEGIKRMGNEMEAEGQAITYYPKRAVGQYYGYGVGKSKIWKDTNVVGCNKHDKDYGESISTKQFALRNSDCSKSVKLGLLSIANPFWPLYRPYPYSEYCVDEAISSDDGKTNVYCNGKTKMKNGTSKGSHINCSWFSGISHSESFHTH